MMIITNKVIKVSYKVSNSLLKYWIDNGWLEPSIVDNDDLHFEDMDIKQCLFSGVYLSDETLDYLFDIDFGSVELRSIISIEDDVNGEGVGYYGLRALHSNYSECHPRIIEILREFGGSDDPRVRSISLGEHQVDNNESLMLLKMSDLIQSADIEDWQHVELPVLFKSGQSVFELIDIV